MSTSTGDNPERLLSAALHAQAGGSRGPEPEPPRAPPGRDRLPVWTVLICAALLGLAAGAVTGVLSML